MVPLQGTRGMSPGACRACPSERELQREESNLRDGRLTGGCLTIRLRWKKSARRGARSKVLRVRGRAFVRQVFRERGASHEVVRGPWFRAQDSNLCFWIQRPASCQLDDPGERRGERPRSQDAAVGPEGLEPSPPRLRVECACRLRYGPETTRTGSRPAREGGTRGSCTLIPRGKSPVLG